MDALQRKWLVILVSSMIYLLPLSAQDSVALYNAFVFQDGLYRDFTSFQENDPDLRPREFRAQIFINPKNNLLKLSRLRTSAGDTIQTAQFWGLTFNGKPYIRLKDFDSPLATFAPLRIRGRLCLYTYPVSVEEEIEITAFNPLNRQPFRRGKVVQEGTDVRHIILSFVTGEEKALNKSNLGDMIRDDDPLWQSLQEIEPEDTDGLIKCLRIYDDRNPEYLMLN